MCCGAALLGLGVKPRVCLFFAGVSFLRQKRNAETRDIYIIRLECVAKAGANYMPPVSATTITDSRKGCPYEWSAMDISGNSCRLRSSGASGSPHPTNCAPINHANSRANNIRPHCICFIYCFEQNKTNPSVYASRIRLPYRGAKIDSATNPNLSIRFMYARHYINVFYHDIIHRKNFPPPCSKISNPCVLYFTRFV